MGGFACHVSIARLVYDSGCFVLDVSPSMLPNEKRKGVRFFEGATLSHLILVVLSDGLAATINCFPRPRIAED